MLEVAAELGNSAEVCRQREMDLTRFYELRRRFQTRGFADLKGLAPIHKSHPHRCASICGPCTTRRQANAGLDDADLRLGLQKDGGDCPGKPFRSFIILSQNFAPSLCSILGAENLLDPVRSDAQRHVDHIVADGALVTHLDPDRVEKDRRTKGFQRPVLLVGDLLQHRVGDSAG